MKTNRQKTICDIIQKHSIETQGELANLLAKYGFDVTQTTVSRDIKELKLIKIPTGDGTYRYTLPDHNSVRNKYNSDILEKHLKGISISGTMLVISTTIGAATLVAGAVDALKNPVVLGTIAGMETVFVAADSYENAIIFSNELKQYIKTSE